MKTKIESVVCGFIHQPDCWYRRVTISFAWIMKVLFINKFKKYPTIFKLIEIMSNFDWIKSLCMLLKRELYHKIYSRIDKKHIILIVGARQVGKTTLLRQLYAEQKGKGEQVELLSFENIDILNEINQHPDNVFKFTKINPEPIIEGLAPKKLFLLIDEIQYAASPSNFLKYLYDTYDENLKIITTGSSAFYIDSKFNDSLAGRKTVFNMNTLSFSEFLYFKGNEHLIEEIDTIAIRSEYKTTRKTDILNMLDEYMLYGGYPAVVLEELEELKIERLNEIRNSYLKRDVLESGIKNETAFYALAKVLADQTGNLVNKNELSNTLQVTNYFIDNAIHVLMKCFHIALLSPFTTNIRKEITKMPKVFFNDLGLRNALLNRFYPIVDRPDKGVLFENFVFLHLKEKYDQDQIKFWRTRDGNEIDFIVSFAYMEGKAFEVKWQNTSFSNSKYSAFSKAYQNYQVEGVFYNTLNVFNK